MLAKAFLYTVNHPKTWQDVDGYVPDLYQEIRWPLLVFQTAAVLEVVHCAVGLVPSAVMTTLLQVYSRMFVVWALVEGVAGVNENVGLLIVSYAWGITEVIRYAYYFFSLLNAVPYPLIWCRYTFFYILYPLGVLGEMLLFFASLPVVRAKQQWDLPLPNAVNMGFSFYGFLVLSMFLYIPLFPQLYGHMIKQRGKIIGGSTATDRLKKD